MSASDTTSERLARFVECNAPVFVVAGAGCSTESGIADYRDGERQWKRPQPVQLADYLKSDTARRRYWARSMLGWPVFARAEPNAAHVALAELERAGWLSILVTQNVDRLHHKAGHRAIVELHGRLDVVVCLQCGARTPRDEIQTWLEDRNPSVTGRGFAPAPDGDADVENIDLEHFEAPACGACGGVLKPDVVFFGESVPRRRVELAMRVLERSGSLLIVGSSVSVYSSFRFCRRARDIGIPLAAVNLGATRADSMLDLKVKAHTGTAMAKLASVLERRATAGVGDLKNSDR